MKKKHVLLWMVPLFLLSVIVLFSIEESRTFIIALFLRVIFFVKQNIIALLTAFFLVKGKFILKLFLKKLVFLSATGLGKRYLVEKVIMNNFKIHFLDHITYDIQRVIRHAKKNFHNFPLGKKIVAVFAFLASLGFVAKSMGGIIAVKVFLAKVWSFLLAVFIQASTAITYFFTDYLWGSWLAPIIEVVLFSWILLWMEKVPFLAKGLRKIYRFFILLFGWIEHSIEKVFHIPLKGFLKWLVKRIRENIDQLIGKGYISGWSRVKQYRKEQSNCYNKLLLQRKSRFVKHKEKKSLTPRESIIEKRKTRNR